MSAASERKYHCIFNDYIVPAHFMEVESCQTGIPSHDCRVDSYIFYLRCTAPRRPDGRVKRDVAADVGTDMAPFSVTINQGQGCDMSCCDITDPCFTGAVSDRFKPYFYFDDTPMSTTSFSPLRGSVHAHTFTHDYHDGSDVPHSHILSVNSVSGTKKFIARSLTTTFDCTCDSGDFDCSCTSTKSQHDHIFYHEHGGGSHSHKHSVQMETPPLGLPMSRPGKAKFDDQRFPFYGIGENDELPSDWASSIQDVKSIEDALIYPSGNTLELSLLDVGTQGLQKHDIIKIVLDKSAGIQVRRSAGESGSHAIQLTNSSREAECGRLGRICGGVVQRNFQVDSVQIEAAIFLDAAITSNVNLTSSKTRKKTSSR